MGFFSRSKSPKKSKGPQTPADEQQQNLLTPQDLPPPPPPQAGPPIPDVASSTPSSSTPAPSGPSSTPPTPQVPISSDARPGASPSASQGGTPTSSNRGTPSKGAKDRRAKGATPAAAGEGAGNAADPSPASAAPSNGTSQPIDRLQHGIKKEMSVARLSVDKVRRNSRGLGYGMGFKKIEPWAQAIWSGAASDRSGGTRGRPVTGKGQKGAAGASGAAKDGNQQSSTADEGFSKWGKFLPVPNIELHTPLPPAPENELPNFRGRWRCTSVDGHWDAYLKLCEVDATRRALALGTFYGRGRSILTIEMPDTNDSITLLNQLDKPFRATLPQKGRPVAGPKAGTIVGAPKTEGTVDDDDEAPAPAPASAEPPLAEAKSAILSNTVSLRIDGTEQQLGTAPFPGAAASLGVVRWEGRALVVRYTVGKDKEPAMLKRTLIDEQTMAVRVMADDFDAVCTYQMIDEEGDVLPTPYKLKE